jgi:hypothetical protein
VILLQTHDSFRARPRLFQALAVFFVLLYALSSVRGYVPGLCLNLRAPDMVATASECSVQPVSACCAAREGREGGSGSVPAAPKNCPFCHLAHGLSEPPLYVHFEPLPAIHFQPEYLGPASVIPQALEDACSGRGPPRLFHG